MSEAGVEKRFAAMNSVRDEIVQCLDDLECWERTFPDKTPQQVALLLAAAEFTIKANGKLMIENEVLRAQKTLTGAQKDWALSEGLRGGHDHSCSCGGSLGQHITGYCGCLREMTVTPHPLENDKWEVGGVAITDTSLREQRMYHQHPCGCWSRAKSGSTNSIEV